MRQRKRVGRPSRGKSDIQGNATRAEGGVIFAPSDLAERETGGWRVDRPVVDIAKCTHCMICWVFCPDASIEVNDGRFVGFDLVHCKGCGICARECPAKCIEMVVEAAAPTLN